MPIQIESVRLYRRNLRTRLPFRYGIATMTDVPHVFLETRVRIDGTPTRGLAADHLPPKWFTKDATRDPREEIEEMAAVIRHAATTAEGLSAPTVFSLWIDLHRRQDNWARKEKLPPLLAHFGTSLVERGLIDAFCRHHQVPFHQALLENRFEIDLAALHPELANTSPADFLPSAPISRTLLRHTVGLADPLESADHPNRIDDGLPETLDECIRTYGLRHLKIKFCGPSDLPRLDRALRLSRDLIGDEAAFTLDGNESFATVADFRVTWAQVEALPVWPKAARRLICVEQPFHRDNALNDETVAALRGWPERPPIIIDESDGENDSVRRALEAGYAGASHKNCKGVFRGIANACLIARRRQKGAHLLHTGEDLCNVGPVALLQDLAVQAALGITSVERNGHHYLRGLSFLPEQIQTEMCEQHPDLYAWRTDGGFASLIVRDGAIDLGSVNTAPFGVAADLDPAALGEPF
jgi:hypothetical protein